MPGGTSTIKASDDGYNVLVGGKLFSGYDKHPNIQMPLPRYDIKSTAAGRYQFLHLSWMSIVRNYGFKGQFIPEAQDLVAIKLLQEYGTLPYIKAGRIQHAITAAARSGPSCWKSTPKSGPLSRVSRISCWRCTRHAVVRWRPWPKRNAAFGCTDS